MNLKKNLNLFLITAICFSVFFLVSCNRKPDSGKLVITLAPFGSTGVNNASGQFLEGAGIVLLDPDKPSAVRRITADFYSACSPDVSWDGKHMLFAGQQKKGEPWQIWQMDIKNGKYFKVVPAEGNCSDPVFLPVNKVIFSETLREGPASNGNALFVCNADGSEPKQITFHPQTHFATSVLKDGRLLVITRQEKPDLKDPVLMVVRPDGTKADLFYKGSAGTSLTGKARESSDGHIYFIENDTSGYGGLVSISYNRPLHSKELISNAIPGDFNSVFPAPEAKLLVSYRENSEKAYGVYEFDVAVRKLRTKIYEQDGFNVVDVIRIDEHNRPKKLPSEVDMAVKTGLLLCQDINFTGMGIADPKSRRATKIEVVGVDSSMGIVNAEADGSFYIKVIADQPFKIRTLDNSNHIVNDESAWLWLRPNERRGCVGCHADKEMAPVNRVSLAVKKNPVVIPVVVSDVKEKEVELE